MPRSSRPERLIQELQDWRDDELEDLAAMITGLLQSRQQEVFHPPRKSGRMEHRWDDMEVEGTSS